MNNQDNPIHKILLFALGYFVLNAITQFTVSGVADLDQSEQLLASQTLSFGYGPQPPLYTWIVWSIFQLTGPNLLSLLVFKAILLTGVLAALLKVGQLLKFTNQQLWITAFGLALIPQFIWESQRDLTHSALSTFFAAWLLWQVIRTIQKPSTNNYLWLGVLAGLGMLSKYNFILFIVAIILVLLIDKPLRPRLFTPKLLLTVIAGLIITAPHAIWMLQNFELAASGTHKLEMAGSVWQGLGMTVTYFISFLTPLWLFALIIVKPWQSTKSAFEQIEIRFLLKLLVIILLLALIIVAITQSQNFKDRWFLPLAFFAPLLVAYRATPSLAQLKWFSGISIFLIILVAILLPARSIVGQYTYLKHDRSVLPVQQLISEVTQDHEPHLIISDDNLIAGNFKNAYPKTATFFYATTFQLDAPADWKKALIVCEREDCLDKLEAIYRTRITGIDWQNIKLNVSTAYIDKKRQHPYRIYWTYIQKTN